MILPLGHVNDLKKNPTFTETEHMNLYELAARLMTDRLVKDLHDKHEATRIRAERTVHFTYNRPEVNAHRKATGQAEIPPHPYISDNSQPFRDGFAPEHIQKVYPLIHDDREFCTFEIQHIGADWASYSITARFVRTGNDEWTVTAGNLRGHYHSNFTLTNNEAIALFATINP